MSDDWPQEDLGEGRMSDVDPDTLYRSAQATLTQQADRIAALEAEVARLKLFIASDVSRAVGLMDSLLPGPLSHDDTHEAYLRRMSALFTAEAEKLAAGVSAAHPSPPEGERAEGDVT